ncbi:hypothetical protein [Dyadobacter sp. CY323]|uniref:hypothetical protein n=1 Tax=Dyadobacter sp. CY323 TaxID=2907302 RepID=UPI001F306E39|nr:hypothetical protein [Dyadobacter sp. CY323]MCE6990930.1 hypothetical protein [Dyadobacter sp. CY323]
MKIYLKSAFALVSAFMQFNDAFSQRQKKGDAFPTYEQIRGDKKETVDYVAPRSQGSVGVIPRYTVRDHHLGAFTYQEDSVTYILNGRKVKSKKKAEYEVNRKDVRIERVSIGEVGKDGKRIVEIDYEPFKVE